LTALASLTIAKAEVPDEEWNKLDAQTQVSSAELNNALSALVLSHKSDAAVMQMRTALAHAQSLMDSRKNIIKLGMAVCHMNPEYNKTHIQFWIRASELTDKTQKVITEIQQSLN
jgi:hypothetical protein